MNCHHVFEYIQTSNIINGSLRHSWILKHQYLEMDPTKNSTTKILQLTHYLIAGS